MHDNADDPAVPATDPTETGPTQRWQAALTRLYDAVDALTEVNYPGSEFEGLIDELGKAFGHYRCLIDN